MNPHERVLAVLDHTQPNRVPDDLSGHRNSGISTIAYNRLRSLLGLPARLLRVYDSVQQLTIVDNDVLELIGVDTIKPGREFDDIPGMWTAVGSPPDPLVYGKSGRKLLMGRPLLNDLITAGLDAINPVQISCEGMSPKGLKRDSGSKLTFWSGGCDTRAILNSAGPDEVRQHVITQLEIMEPGGGFFSNRYTIS